MSHRDEFTFVVGGKAGDGTKKTGIAAAKLFAYWGRHVFAMDDYPSLIRGGHNFTAVSTALRPITSHYLHLHVCVACDKRSYDAHIDEMNPDGIMVFNSDDQKEGKGIGIPMRSTMQKIWGHSKVKVGVTGVAVLACAIGMSKADLKKFIEAEFRRDTEKNLTFVS